MTSLGFVVRMAAREVRASPRRLLLLTTSVAVGVAALVAINSFTANLRDSVRRQAQELLGADLSLEARQPLPASAKAVIDTLVSRGAEAARVINFSAMAYVPRTDGTRLVQVAAIEGGYPFYGRIRTDPEAAWSELPGGRHVVVDPSLLTALRARVGDTLALGEARFVISGTVASAPGNVGLRAAFGPRIFIPARYLDDTRLLGFGARAEYEAYLRLPAGISAESVAEAHRATLRGERVRIRTVADDRERLNETLSRLTGYLGLVALIALLLGGIGVASAVVVFIRQRMDTIAVLRCLGATGRRVLAVYGVEAAGMALAGSLVGALVGVGFQQALPGLLADLLPVDVETGVSWSAIGIGVGMGLWVALVFALFPLLSVRRVPPLAALRRDFEPESRPRDPWRWGVVVALAASTVGLAGIQVGNGRQGAIFAGGVAVALLVLWAASWALVRAARHWLPEGLPYLWRQGLSNLHRPSNQTVTVVLAIGFGAFLLGTLVLVQLNLLQQLRLSGGPARPNLVLFDIQPDQLSAVRRELREAGLTGAAPVPIVPMRIASVKGRAVRGILTDTSAAGVSGAWAFRREYRSTFRDSLVGSERLAAGTWWKPRDGAKGTNGGAAPGISIETGLAEELGVGRGRRDRVGRAGDLDGDADHQPARGGLGPLRAELLRGVRAGVAGRRAAHAGDADPDRRAGRARRVPAAPGGAAAQRHHARPLGRPGGARAAGGSGGPGDPLHGGVHPRHRHTGADRRAGDEPVPADPRRRPPPHPRRHPVAALPHRARGVLRARRDGRRGRRRALGRRGVGARKVGVRRAVLAPAAVAGRCWCWGWWR